MKRRVTGFSLLELLVAIAIISTLMGLVLPSLSHARRTGFTARCAANLRQLGVGWSIYADQNNGAIVPGRPGKFSDASQNVYWVGNGYQYRPRWFVRIGAECGFFAFRQPSTAKQDDNRLAVDGNGVFLCPQAAERVNNRNYTYGYNYQFLGNTRFKGGNAANGSINHPVKLEHLRASETVMAADTLGTSAGKPANARTRYRSDGSGDVRALGNHGWSLDPPRLPPGSDYCDNNHRAPEHRSAPEMRHGNKANVLYCDGHVERSDHYSLGYVQRSDGSIAAEDVGARNHLFSGTGRDDDPPKVQ